MSVPISTTAGEAEALRQAEGFACGLHARVGDPAISALIAQAAEHAGVAMACVTMPDHDAERVIAAHGFAASRLPFQHAISAKGMGWIPDAPRDPHAFAHPWVAGPPYARALGWHPLWVRPDIWVGTLYLLDPANQPAGEDQRMERMEWMRACAADLVEEILRERSRPDLAAQAIEPIVELIRKAACADREALIVALDRILRRVETAARSERG